ncbi:hypothetical protein KBB68_00910 [Candidatus Babeliales bacterium]|nr:hypothetical protein [Candidatus Babeliales bacterium]
MKIINFILYLSIIPSITWCSITKDKSWTWTLACNPDLIITIQAGSSGTYFNSQRGTLIDPTHEKKDLCILIAPGIAQKIEKKDLSSERIAFLITTTLCRHHTLIYNPSVPTEIAYFDINQPSKTFASDPEDIQELKRIIQQGPRSQK